MGRRGRDIPENYQSQLLDDSEKIDKFCNIAMRCASNLSKKYYSVNKVYPPEDVVHEVLANAIKRKTDFSAERSRSFYRFVEMLVKSTYKDLLKSVESQRRKVSAEVSIQEDTSDEDSDYNLEKRLGYIDSGILEVEDRYDIDGFLTYLRMVEEDLFEKVDVSGVELSDVVKYRLKGYNNTDIATIVGVDSQKIGTIMKNSRDLLMDVCEDYFGIRVAIE